METFRFEITIEVGSDIHGDTEGQPTQHEIKEWLETMLSWQHPHDARRYFNDVKIVSKRKAVA
jgi:hypothetical protein